MFMGLNHLEIETDPAHSEAVLSNADYDFSATITMVSWETVLMVMYRSIFPL